MSLKKNIVVYHKNCLDGFAAAWSAWLKFKDQASYLAVEHQAENHLIDQLTNRVIFFLDFAFGEAERIKKLAKNNEKIVLIDHHISQKHLQSLYDESVYNEKHSGAVLAWKYFHKKKSVPKLLKYIEDVDLWHFKLKHTKELTAALNIYNMDFNVWQKVSRDFESAESKKKYLEEGKCIIRYQNKIIERMINYAETVSFVGYSALAINSPILVSELGNSLSQKSGTFAIIWRHKKRGLEVSLRSTGLIDVSKIAEKYGGGGHKAAAGFMIKTDKNFKFPWKKIK